MERRRAHIHGSPPRWGTGFIHQRRQGETITLKQQPPLPPLTKSASPAGLSKSRLFGANAGAMNNYEEKGSSSTLLSSSLRRDFSGSLQRDLGSCCVSKPINPSAVTLLPK